MSAGSDAVRKYKKEIAAGGLVVAAAAIFLFAKGRTGELPALNITAPGTKAVVVVDAGHGGFDPGKVGTRNTLEKDINLAIAKKVEKKLKDSGYQVYMTRTEDKALCLESDTSKKRTDLKNRVEMINRTKPALAVSIHQNSYSAGTSGAQVFYYKNSEEGKKLGNVLQNTIRDVIGDGNHRVEKGNDSYYMLRKVSCPFAIVECGFLSNPNEEALLCEEKYQQKMASGICEGIENFLYK